MAGRRPATQRRGVTQRPPVASATDGRGVTMARPARLERATSWSATRRSIQLSYGRFEVERECTERIGSRRQPGSRSKKWRCVQSGANSSLGRNHTCTGKIQGNHPSAGASGEASPSELPVLIVREVVFPVVGNRELLPMSTDSRDRIQPAEGRSLGTGSLARPFRQGVMTVSRALDNLNARPDGVEVRAQSRSRSGSSLGPLW